MNTPPDPAQPKSRVWQNFGQLLTGRVLSAVLTLMATAVMARTLGASEFGLVVLMHTYVLTARALLNLKPAETFVNFGVPLIDGGETEQVNRLLGLIRSFEIVTMLIATAVAVLAAAVVGPLLGISDAAVPVLMAYSLVLLTSPVGTARGFCRATERFDVLRTSIAIGPAVRLSGVLIAWYFEAGWQYFALAWALSLGVAYGYLWWRGARLIKVAGFQPKALAWRRAEREFSGLPGFVGVVYLQGLLDQLPRHLITLLIGGLLGSASAGFYRVAREIADVLAKPVQLIRQASFTEITRLSNSGPSPLKGVFVRYGLRMLLPAVVLLVVVSYFRADLLRLVAGAEFRVAGTLLVLLLIAAAIDLVGAVLRPMAYAFGRAHIALRVQLLAMVTYLGLFVGLHARFGLESVGVAAIAAASLTLLILGSLVGRWGKEAQS